MNSKPKFVGAAQPKTWHETVSFDEFSHFLHHPVRMSGPWAKNGRKRPRSRSPADKANAPSPAPARRRIQPDILAPTDVRMRVTNNGSTLHIERTDDDEEAAANPSWVATTPGGGGIMGQGTTELIRRQLDILDAFAPGATVQFAIRRRPGPSPSLSASNPAIERPDPLPAEESESEARPNRDRDVSLDDVSDTPPPREPSSSSSSSSSPSLVTRASSSKTAKLKPKPAAPSFTLRQDIDPPGQSISSPENANSTRAPRPPTFPRGPGWEYPPDREPWYRGWDAIRAEAEEARLKRAAVEEGERAESRSQSQSQSAREERGLGRRGRFKGAYTLTWPEVP